MTPSAARGAWLAGWLGWLGFIGFMFRAYWACWGSFGAYWLAYLVPWLAYWPRERTRSQRRSRPGAEYSQNSVLGRPSEVPGRPRKAEEVLVSL